MYLTNLTLTALPRPDLWAFAAPLIWCDAKYGRIEIPVGFITDLASTPFHVDDTGYSRRPAGTHDGLYKLYRRLGKDYADAFLRDAILAEGGGHMRSQVYYRAVQWFGRCAWGSDEAPVSAADFDGPVNFDAWLATAGAGRSLAR